MKLGTVAAALARRWPVRRGGIILGDGTLDMDFDNRDNSDNPATEEDERKLEAAIAALAP